MKLVHLIAGATLSLLAAVGAANATTIMPAVEFATGTGVGSGGQFTLGYSFSLSSAVTVNALGYVDDGLGNAHMVGIWDSTGALLASTTVLGSDPSVGHFRWDTISNLTLGAGQYTIAGEYLGDGGAVPLFATGVTTIPQFTWITDEQQGGPGLNYPTFSTGGTYGQNGLLAASFSVAVPEPATWGLMLIGFAGLGAAMRTRRRLGSSATA